MSSADRETKSIVFPVWQVDRREYDAVCAHLGLTPRPHLYDRLCEHLAGAPFRNVPPRGFALFLAGRRLTRWRIVVMDAGTRLFFPEHPVRHVLNATLALHECDGAGYVEMARAPTGWAIVPAILAGGLGYAARVAVALPWLGGAWMAYRLRKLFRRDPDLASLRILVTGVNRGLGKDLMFHCLERGAEVVGTVRTAETMARVRSWLPPGARVTLIAADLSRPETLTFALRECGIAAESLRMAILSAGIKHDGESVLSLPSLRDTLQVNFFSAAEFAAWFCGTDSPSGAPKSPRSSTDGRAVAAVVDARGPAVDVRRLALVSSMGRWHGMHATAGYNASKAALSIWAESLDMELRQIGSPRVTVTVVEPGLFESGMMKATTLTRGLHASRREVAARIVDGALAGKATLRPPLLFALLTWGLCAAGRSVRSRLLARAKPPVGRE